MIESEELARACAQAASDKKAEDILLFDLRGISSFADFFVVCSGSSDPQLKAIASEIRTRVRELTGKGPLAEDGQAGSHWVVIDYAQVVVHIFGTEMREYYSLETLWGDAPVVEFEEEPAQT